MNVQRVIELLKGLEGWRDYVYDDKSPWPRSEVTRAECELRAGQYKVLVTGGTATVGYGETGADFIDRYWGRRITQDEALAKMAERVPGFYQGVLRCIAADLTEHQWEAITCRAYQAGAGGFCRSETARRLNFGDIAGALVYWRSEFAHPDRSEVEIAHFMTPDEETRTVETWHPRAHRAAANRGGGSYIGVAPKIVLHTVEGSGRYSYNPSSYYGNPYWPHCTIDPAGIHQHLPIDVSAFALANSAGGAETNRANAIQCEVLWFAGRIDELPDATMRHLADWVGWVAEQTGAPIEFAEFSGEGSYGENAPQRFSAREWLDFTGICGHQHVPENDHWDPGAFPVDRLRSLLGPTPSKEDQLFSPSPVHTVHIISAHSGFMLTSAGDTHLSPVTQQRSNGSLNQRWQVIGHADGKVSLVNRAGDLALDRPDYSTEAETRLQVARTEHNDAQRWSLDQMADSLFRIWVPGTNCLVDIRGASKDEGAEAQLWYGQPDYRWQQFTFAPTI